MKNWLKKILIITLELSLIAGALWFVAEKRGIHSLGRFFPMAEKGLQQKSLQPFPELQKSEERNFSWTYKSVKYQLSLTLYQSVYEYYQKEPKTYSYDGQLPTNWEDSYYGMFLRVNENDQTISQLVERLQTLGKKHNLSSDQLVELALAFVQSIEYDDAKAGNILGKSGDETMLYPYETLFEQKGVCSDKSLLAILILRKMGYGTAIFTYEEENHMAIGIKCPKSYSTYGSGYCYAETTSVGNKIGIIPQFDAQSKKTAEVAEIADFDQAQQQQASLQDLGQVTVYQLTDGKEYVGIIEIKKIENEIQQLKLTMKSLGAKLVQQKKNLSQELTELEKQKDTLGAFQDSKNYEKYNALVEKYNVLVESYKKDVKNYNSDVALYNQTVGRYNLLIKQ